MKAQTGKARAWISEALGHCTGAKILRVVALGALLVGATALYSSMSQGEAGSSPASTIDQRFPPGTLSEDTAGETEIFDEGVLPGRYREGSVVKAEGEIGISDEGVLPGRYWTVRAPGEEKATPSIDQRFPPGTLPED
ncbi:MAG TPA: hypothetical protein VI855_02420 [Dehalococcoidia bacterium]|nr:hypothetical protein [Dehalococcoidia bacterium]